MDGAMRILALLLVVIVGCGGRSTPPATPSPPEVDVLAELAKEIDPGPQSPAWPQVDAAVRKAVEDHVREAERAPGERLKAARQRLANWTIQFSTADPQQIVQRLAIAFEGVFLVEPLALGGTDPEARSLLFEFYGAFGPAIGFVRQVSASWGVTDPSYTKVLDVGVQLAAAGEKQRDHIAAELLRDPAPAVRDGVAVFDLLWRHAARKRRDGDVAGARRLFGEVLRRRAQPKTFGEWAEKARAELALDDTTAAASTIERARGALPADDRLGLAALRDLERTHAATRQLAIAAADPLKRFDALLDLERLGECGALLDELRAARPLDARVRARVVMLQLARGDVAAVKLDELRDDQLTDRDATYWSVRIGAAGMAFSETATRESLDEIIRSGQAIAAFEPGRAAVLALIAERVSPLVGNPIDDQTIVKVLREAFPAAVALRAKHRDVADADRAVLATAMFAADPVAAFAAVIAHPVTPPDADAELYLDRARVAVTLAAFLGASADLDAVAAAVAEIPPRDRDLEGRRTALVGDVAMLRWVYHRDADARSAALHAWSAALERSQIETVRLLNNVGYLVATGGGDEQDAYGVYQRAIQLPSERRWIPLLNLAGTKALPAGQAETLVRELANGPKASALVLAHVAKAETDPAAASSAAQRALAALDAPLAFHQLDLALRGIATEGAFKLGVGLRSMRNRYELSASSSGALWLVRPMPFTRAELEAKAKAKPGKKPAR
jgi:hypothetical protein